MRIDFYVIEDEHPDAPRRVAARLLEKAYAQNLRAWILCANQKEAELLDDWLHISSVVLSVEPHNCLTHVV